MTWCDKLAAQPAIAFFMEPYFGGGEATLSRLSPLIKAWDKIYSSNIEITIPEPTKLNIQFDDGFMYLFEPSKVTLQFQHRIRYRAVSGSLPVVELISKPTVYSSLLDEAAEKLIEVTALLPDAGQRHVTKIGILTQAAVSYDDLPPGVRLFHDYLAAPWNGKLLGMNALLTSELRRDEATTDLCIHQFVKSEEADSLVNIRFDWQRSYSKGPVLMKRELEKISDSAIAAAMAYFEELAVGDNFDVSI